MPQESINLRSSERASANEHHKDVVGAVAVVPILNQRVVGKPRAIGGRRGSCVVLLHVEVGHGKDSPRSRLPELRSRQDCNAYEKEEDTWNIVRICKVSETHIFHSQKWKYSSKQCLPARNRKS